MTREEVIAEARSWIGTPYRHRGRAKGPNGGVDCAQFVYLVFHAVGLSPDMALDEYPPDWHLNRSAERYMDRLLQHTQEVVEPQGADIALFKIGRAYAHGGIITQWPNIIHAWQNAGGVLEQRADTGLLAGREVKFFSRW